MKKNIALFVSMLMILTLITFAYAGVERVINGKGFNYEYNDRMYQISHIIRTSNGNLISTSEHLPRNTDEAHELFEEACAPRTRNQDLNKKVTVTHNGFLTTNTFECDSRQEETNQVNTVQFVVTVDKDDHLKDLQINQLKAITKASEVDPRKMTLKAGSEIAIAVAASTLVSGLVAKQIYAGQHDKFVHATGGSLIAATATLLSYYKLKLSENQAALIGFATAVAVGLLKEYAYDARHKDTHTVDVHDAEATAMGGGVGALFVRLKFEF